MEPTSPDLDVIIIGGGFAGLAAAMPLSRARRRVLLIDAGQPRNRFAAASHGFLGQDGVPPTEILARARRELAAYPTFTFTEGLVTQAAGSRDDFTVTLENGDRYRARRLILALGQRDTLPTGLPGLGERWGRSVLHCPYCHGYEVAGRPLGLLASGLAQDHRGLLLPDWGPTTLFLQGTQAPEPDMAARLAARGVTVEPAPIVELLGPSPALEAVRLADGRTLPLAALFVATRTEVASPIARQLGCTTEDGINGVHLWTDPRRQTSVPGVFAAGDAAMAMHNGMLAAASGSMAGFAAHHSLLMD